MTFFGLLVLTILAFTEWLGIFVVSPKIMEALAFFPHTRKASHFVPSGLYMPLLEMKLGKFWFNTALPLGFLIIGLHGRGLAFKPFSSFKNLCTFKALLLSRAYGKLGKLSNLGFTSLVMGFVMGFLLISRKFGGLHYFPSRVFLCPRLKVLVLFIFSNVALRHLRNSFLGSLCVPSLGKI